MDPFTFMGICFVLFLVGSVIIAILTMIFPPREPGPKRNAAYWTKVGEDFRAEWSDAFKRMELTDEQIEEYVSKYVNNAKKNWKNRQAEKRKWWKHP